MSNILQIGFTAEGVTDKRFLQNIIRRTYEELISECQTDIDVYDPVCLEKEGDNFVEQMMSIAGKYNYFHVICIHCDADAPTSERVIRYKLDPAFNAIRSLDSACHNLVSIIPVQMIEAWLMVDFSLLKEKIGTDLSNAELSLPQRIGNIESLTNPKELISNALTIAQNDISRRRRKLTLSTLYSPISQEINLNLLKQLSSYLAFYQSARNSLIQLNYLTQNE
ncbi:MAG: DUF4276 family protein [Bacteroidales bacterium]|nr:DUF4276 family protein [Bacteroidales bacterium]